MKRSKSWFFVLGVLSLVVLTTQIAKAFRHLADLQNSGYQLPGAQALSERMATVEKESLRR